MTDSDWAGVYEEMISVKAKEPKSGREEIYEQFEKEYGETVTIELPFDPCEVRNKIQNGLLEEGDVDKVVRAPRENGLKVSGKKDTYWSGAQRDSQEGKLRYLLIPPAALERMAALYTRGAAHYGDRNWERGLPYSRILESVFRHFMAVWQGDTSEDHKAAVAWGMFALMHYDREIERGKLPKELNDL